MAYQKKDMHVKLSGFLKNGYDELKVYRMLPALANAKASSSNPLLSIVLTSYTDKRLGDVLELLESVKAQTYPSIEIVYIIERSIGLLYRLQSYLKEEGILNVKVIFDSRNLGLSAARNLGIKNAGGEIIAFIDDDVILPPEWAEEVVRTYGMRSDIVGVTGPALPLWSGGPIKWLPDELYWIIGSTTWFTSDSVKEVRHAWGMNMSFKKDAFDLCGGFSLIHGLRRGEREGVDRFPHEDVELSLRIKAETGKRIFYNPRVSVMHRVHPYKLNLRFICENAYTQGFAKRMLKDLSKNTDILERERVLLRRIFANLFPSVFREFFKEPKMAWHKFTVTVVALFCLALGYYSPYHLILRKRIARAGISTALRSSS